MTRAQQDRLEDVRLPALRPELALLPGAADAHGQPTWLVHDPILNRFIQIEAAAYEALRLWPECATIGEVVERSKASGRVAIDAQACRALIEFLQSSQLSLEPGSGGWQAFAKLRAKGRHSLPTWLIHNYLFFRIPLVRPQVWLDQTLPVVRKLWSLTARRVMVSLGLIGLYFASRQWDHFLGTLMTYFSWEGILSGIVALLLIKVVHELGHAYAATAFGCRVHSMGIAFVVMAPMPYTDVTDAWRLTDRRKRLLIDSAGIISEAGVAAIALFLWAFLPDGPIRSAAFVLSSVRLISSLAINLNPFMRFDGYYLLSELLGVENLQARSFELGCWKLREWLFGLGIPCPEEMSKRRIAILIAYAWSVWIYRLFLFVGIALLVYHYFFKVLGIILFAVEIVVFVARPIINEMRAWWGLRKVILARSRVRWSAAAAAAIVLVSIVPWSATVEIPAIIETEKLQVVYPIRNARVQEIYVKHGELVRAGQPIAKLASSDIEDEIRRLRISLHIAEVQYNRRISDAVDREGSLVLEGSIAAYRNRIAGLEKEREELTLLAPFEGRIVDINTDLKVGRWISPREMIAVVAGGSRMVARGYVEEADLGRLDPGVAATFVPDHPLRHSIKMKVERIATAGATQIEVADLSSQHMGRITTTLDDRRRHVPTSAQYMVTLSATQPVTDEDLSVRGLVLAKGRPESILARAWRRALGILIRESGA